MNEASRALIKKGKFKEALKILAKCEEILEVKGIIPFSLFLVCCEFWQITGQKFNCCYSI